MCYVQKWQRIFPWSMPFNLQRIWDRNIVIEGDALRIISTITSMSPDFSHIGNLTWEAHVFGRDFQTSQFQHVRRQANFAGHTLAKQVLTIVLLYWMEDYPDCIKAIYLLVVARYCCDEELPLSRITQPKPNCILLLKIVASTLHL